jgi:hypothetical protein
MTMTAPALWSAIAASFAALSSFLIMLIQRRNLLESVRPELVLTGWNRFARGNGDAAHEVISFQTIRNVGRGVALNIILNLEPSPFGDGPPTTVLSTSRLPLLAATEAADTNREIIVWWKNVKPDAQGHKFLPITVLILCWDARGMRHETRYKLLAVELLPNVGVADAIAPGIMLGSRTTATIPIWWSKIAGKTQRVLRGLQRSREERNGKRQRQ